jgi:transcriptional regulator with XRE-family HTH domain
MDEGFSPSKNLAQVKVLAPLDGQAVDIHRKFSMAKGAPQKRQEPPSEHALQRTFIRQWRKKAGLNQTALAAILDVSTATVSQIENAETGYKQEYLERIAGAVGCEPADLLVRAPDDPDPIWRLWDEATAAQRKQIVRVAAALLAPNGNS